MKAPRVRIARVMVAVAVVALDFAAGRAMVDSGGKVGAFMMMGALPMANILAVAILIGRRRLGSRPFLLGFETFGTMAVALFVVSLILLDGELWVFHLTPKMRYYQDSNSDDLNFIEPPRKVIGNR